jgi:hypothetical protein
MFLLPLLLQCFSCIVCSQGSKGIFGYFVSPLAVNWGFSALSRRALLTEALQQTPYPPPC